MSQLANIGAQNIVVAMNPADYLTQQLAKADTADTAGTYLGWPPGLTARIASVATITQGKLLGFSASGTGPNWADREGITVVSGLKNDDLTKNKITLLCEGRGKAFVRDPQHVAYGDAHA